MIVYSQEPKWKTENGMWLYPLPTQELDMHDWEDLEFNTIDEEKQSRRGKLKLYFAFTLLLLVFLAGLVTATVVYGWFGLFAWLFGSGLVLVIVIQSNGIRYR